VNPREAWAGLDKLGVTGSSPVPPIESTCESWTSVVNPEDGFGAVLPQAVDGLFHRGLDLREPVAISQPRGLADLLVGEVDSDYATSSSAWDVRAQAALERQTIGQSREPLDHEGGARSTRRC